jgi:hypothetical protein
MAFIQKRAIEWLGRTTNGVQVFLPQGPWIQSGSQRTLLGAFRTHLLIFTNEAMSLLVEER